jgi:enamine deaminase RidA (YjgF/YER057c/UK114 family)
MTAWKPAPQITPRATAVVESRKPLAPAAGAKLSDKVHVLTPSIATRRSSGLCRRTRPVWGDRKPAWTLAPVPALALEGMLVEIDFIAVVPP